MFKTVTPRQTEMKGRKTEMEMFDYILQQNKGQEKSH